MVNRFLHYFNEFQENNQIIIIHQKNMKTPYFIKIHNVALKRCLKKKPHQANFHNSLIFIVNT